MDNFKKKFVEEATDLINDLEGALLSLEQDPEDVENIQAVFRIMHTLKGNSSMFGFDKIDAFTHELETIYDLIRNDKLKLSENILNLTLASVDHLKVLLIQDENLTDEAIQDHKNLLDRINKINKTDTKSEIVAEVVHDINKEEVTSVIDDTADTYYIHFDPNLDIFKNGTNPLYLIDELFTLGKCLAIPYFKKFPEFENIEENSCYTYWDIFISTTEEVNSLTDVFIFVEDECQLDIHKLADVNLLENSDFVEKINELKIHEKEINIDEIERFVKELAKKEVKPKVVNAKKDVVQRENTISSIRVSSEKLDELMNLVSELVTTQARLSLYAEESGKTELLAISENVQKLSRQLRDNAFSIVLIPIENVLTRFQRLVRDLSSELKKDVVFVAEGAETELDKTIIESLSDPLLHIIRNSLDHGVEEAYEREQKGKDPQAKILLKAFYSGANVIIEIHDDGRGIDPDKIFEKAVNKGIISKDAVLSRKEILDLIFLPGFSTAHKITEVSGRGVGMDVVKRKISEIRGEVDVDSVLGDSTTISIKLPLTLSIIDGLLVKIADNYYVMPLSVVDKIYAVEHTKLVNTFNNVVIVDNEQIPFYYLREEFDLEEGTETFEQVIIVKYEEKQIGLVVDYVVGEYQAVLKPLGKHYKDQEMISGATILGDGTVALVMDTNKIIRQFSTQKINLEELK